MRRLRAPNAHTRSNGAYAWIWCAPARRSPSDMRAVGCNSRARASSAGWGTRGLFAAVPRAARNGTAHPSRARTAPRTFPSRTGAAGATGSAAPWRPGEPAKAQSSAGWAVGGLYEPRALPRAQPRTHEAYCSASRRGRVRCEWLAAPSARRARFWCARTTPDNICMIIARARVQQRARGAARAPAPTLWPPPTPHRIGLSDAAEGSPPALRAVGGAALRRGVRARESETGGDGSRGGGACGDGPHGGAPRGVRA